MHLPGAKDFLFQKRPSLIATEFASRCTNQCVVVTARRTATDARWKRKRVATRDCLRSILANAVSFREHFLLILLTRLNYILVSIVSFYSVAKFTSSVNQYGIKIAWSGNLMLYPKRDVVGSVGLRGQCQHCTLLDSHRNKVKWLLTPSTFSVQLNITEGGWISVRYGSLFVLEMSRGHYGPHDPYGGW